MVNKAANQKSAVFYLGIVFLVFSMLFIGIGLYLLPHLLFGWIYDVPQFILAWREDIVGTYHLTHFVASLIIFSIFFILAILSVYCTILCSSQLSPEIPKNESPENHAGKVRLRRDLQSTSYYLIRIIMVVLAIIVLIEIIEYLLFIEPNAKL